MRRMNFRLQAKRYVVLVSVSLTLVQLCLFVYAEDKLDLQKIYDESQKTAQTLNPKLQELAKGGTGIEKIHEVLQNKEGNANHQTTELGSLPIAGEKAKENDTEKASCTKAECNVSHLMSTEAMNKREAKLEEYGFRKDKEQFPEDNKGYIDKARHNAKKYETKFDAISGSYKDCKSKDHAYSYKESEECDEYYDVKYSNCPISQIVEIDPHYTYDCNKKREESIKTCHDEITSINCNKSSECDNGGIMAKSVQSDMKWEYNFPTLTLGTIADNYWTGHCAIYDRTTSFQVKNLSKITEFRIFEVGFDDYLWIKINGNTIYVGPDGGDRVEMIDKVSEERSIFGVRRNTRRGVTTNGENLLGCERNTSWTRAVNIDLRPYLKEGENSIWMRVLVSGAGEGWMKISAKQHCCRDEDWVVQREIICNYEGM